MHPVGMEFAAAVVEMAVLAYQGRVRAMRRDRQDNKNCRSS
jgi:hypothetical protein